MPDFRKSKHDSKYVISVIFIFLGFFEVLILLKGTCFYLYKSISIIPVKYVSIKDRKIQVLYLKLPVEQGLQALKELTFPHRHNFEFPCLYPLHSILPLFQPFHQLHSLSQVLGKNRGRYRLCKSFLRLPLFYTELLGLAKSAFGSHLPPTPPGTSCLPHPGPEPLMKCAA